MAKKTPGLFSGWKGLYARGSTDNCPADHLADCLNLIFAPNGDLQSREGTTILNAATNVVRMALYKPNPPFAGINIPRPIILTTNGDLIDVVYYPQVLYHNASMVDFGFVNFFGRCYISPSDGKTGLNGEKVYLYDGTGPTGFRQAAGVAPTLPLTATMHFPAGTGKLSVGTYLFSYAFETKSGFITQTAPFIALNSFGGGAVDISNLPVGSSNIVARWLVSCKAIPLPADLNVPFDVSRAQFFPQYLVQRINDNTTTVVSGFSFYDEQLVNTADNLFTNLATIPAGVGLIDFKGRMVSYGEYANPSIVRVSEIGSPESFDSTSGFFITDPADSTGIRCATEFRNTLYVFKQQRGYATQDNGDEASTWDVVNFEKAIGTEQQGISALLDAKGSTSEGFVLADREGLKFFNGVFQEPELTYKIRDYWKRINYKAFYKVQVAIDPINKRIYVLIPLDNATVPNYILYADYRDGLDPVNIKWCPWRFDPTNNNPNSILIFNDFGAGDPNLVTILSSLNQISGLNVGTFGPQNDTGTPITITGELAPFRFLTTGGISIYSNVNFRAFGKGVINSIAYGMDKIKSFQLRDLILNNETPGREYSIPMNLVNEQCRFFFQCVTTNGYIAINSIYLEGKALWKGRPR